MTAFYIKCPCCNEKLRIEIDDNGFPIVFFCEKHEVSENYLSDNFNLDFGVASKGVNDGEL